MTYFLCNVPSGLAENYAIGVKARRWGVKEEHKSRIANAAKGDFIIFLVAGEYKTLHKIESDPFFDDSRLWPGGDGDAFPCRVKIGPALAKSGRLAKDLACDISFMKGKKKWSGTVQGRNGVFNDRLVEDDVQIIFGVGWETKQVRTSPVPERPARPSPDPRIILSEKDAEEFVERLLPQMNLRKHIDQVSGRDGRGYSCEAGRIDFLCLDENKEEFVVVQMKRGDPIDEAVIQILRYMTWVRQNLADGWDVRGVIMAEGIDERLDGILQEAPNVTVQRYKITIELV